MQNNPLPLAEIRAAQARIADTAIRTPFLRLNDSDFGRQSQASRPLQSGTPEGVRPEIYLKLENLQPIGSFKLRGAGNAIRSLLAPDGSIAADSPLRSGVFTASAGNMAQGVAWTAARLGLACTVIVPDHAPQTKLDAIERFGANIVKVPFEEWWNILLTHEHPAITGHFVHPVSDPAVIAGNGVIGLEIYADLPDVDAVVVPYGGGGLTSGIASALKQLNPDVRVFAAEVETAAPLAASLAAGKPQEVEYSPSFVDGIGGKSVLPEMWPLVQQLVDESLVVSLQAVADAIRFLALRHRIIAEGAGAAPVAAALSGAIPSGKVVCIISGGNIDAGKLVKILRGEVP